MYHCQWASGDIDWESQDNFYPQNPKSPYHLHQMVVGCCWFSFMNSRPFRVIQMWWKKGKIINISYPNGVWTADLLLPKPVRFQVSSSGFIQKLIFTLLNLCPQIALSFFFSFPFFVFFRVLFSYINFSFACFTLLLFCMV